ncbi:MAG TPA: hypothetical protein PLZ55_17660, partial [bacterium]|nr:hypothetical protein [bacterium]
LIVVAIIGILAAIAVPNFINARVKATVAKVYSETKAVNDAYMMYNLDTNKWPPHLDGDLAQHRFVTTPIAYLSTSLRDPFQQEGITSTQTLGWYRGQYHEEPNFQMLEEFVDTGDRAAKVYAQANRNAAFFCRSVGPDMDRTYEITLPYDMTNGLNSQGTICTPMPGSWKSQYPYTQY